jgi:hypothetical protein
MSKHGHRITLDKAFLAITALFVLGGFMALGFLQNQSQENRALLVIVSSTGMIASLACLGLLSVFWRRLRRWTWQRAMTRWDRISRAGSAPNFCLPESIQEDELRQLATRTFARMGYRIARRPNEGAYLTLINPDGRIELVAFRGQPVKVDLHHVYSLELEMRRTGALCGFFWAPAGFTEETMEWASRRSIVLADGPEIGRLVVCAQSKGSRFLQYGPAS